MLDGFFVLRQGGINLRKSKRVVTFEKKTKKKNSLAPRLYRSRKTKDNATELYQ